MLEDAFKSIKESLEERVSSPLIGSFVFAWIFWNYRLVMTLISSQSVEDKFKYIDLKISEKILTVFDVSLIPALYAVLFILIYPLFSFYIFKYWRWWQVKTFNMRNEVDQNKLLTVEQSLDLRRQIFEAEEFAKEEIAKRDATIKGLKDKFSGRGIQAIVYDNSDNENVSLEEVSETDKGIFEALTLLGEKK